MLGEGAGATPATSSTRLTWLRRENTDTPYVSPSPITSEAPGKIGGSLCHNRALPNRLTRNQPENATCVSDLPLELEGANLVRSPSSELLIQKTQKETKRGPQEACAPWMSAPSKAGMLTQLGSGNATRVRWLFTEPRAVSARLARSARGFSSGMF